MELTGCVFIAMNVNQIDEKEGELDWVIGLISLIGCIGWISFIG